MMASMMASGAAAVAAVASGTPATAAAVAMSATATISQENAYIQNPGFPAALTTTGTVNYVVSKKDQG